VIAEFKPEVPGNYTIVDHALAPNAGSPQCWS
jgi:hypothetical protein